MSVAPPVVRTRRRRRHRFSPEIASRIKAARALDNWHAPLAVVYVWSLIAVTIAASHLLAPVTGWWPPYLVSVFLLGCWQRALATLLHESAHKVLAESRALNFLLGTVASGYLVLQSWHAYKRSHVDGHHTNLGDDEADPDLKFLQGQGVYRPQSSLAFAWRFLVAPLFLLRTPAKLVDLFRYRFLSKDEPWWEKTGRSTYLVALASALVGLGYGGDLLLYWIVPYLTAFPMVNWYIELLEHFPLVKRSDVDLYMSRNRWTGPVSKFLFGVFNENYHQTHHLVPQYPFWRLPMAHKILLDDPAYRSTQYREVGLVFPVIWGVPSMVLALFGAPRTAS